MAYRSCAAGWGRAGVAHPGAALKPETSCTTPGPLPPAGLQAELPPLGGPTFRAAPIWTYRGERPAYDDGSFAAIVTRDASAEGGSAPACAANVREAWRVLMHMGKTGATGAHPEDGVSAESWQSGSALCRQRESRGAGAWFDDVWTASNDCAA